MARMLTINALIHIECLLIGDEMGILNIFKRKTRVKGLIEYFGLVDWWLSEFTETEQQYIDETQSNAGFGSGSLIKGDIDSTTQTAIGMLTNLALLFTKEENRTIAYRILEKAEALMDENTTPLDAHFLYHAKIKLYYRHRDNDTDAYSNAIDACKQQIQIAPFAATAFKTEYVNSALPGHTGFEQLAIIEEKQKKYNAAIDLAKTALEQGWAGDWEKRINRCKKKMEK